MEWDFVPRVVVGWGLWGLPIILVIVAGTVLFPLLFLAGAGLRLYDIVRDIPRRRATSEMQLPTDTADATAVWKKGVVSTVGVFPRTRATEAERTEEAEVKEPKEVRVRKRR